MSKRLPFIQPKKSALGAKFWGHVHAFLDRQAEDRGREREDAVARAAELMTLPREQRLAAVETEERFWTLGLLDRLLATAAQGPLERVEALSELALGVARRLDPQRYGPTALAERTAVAWCRWADTRRRRGDLTEAEKGFLTATRLLEGGLLDVPEWAVYCLLAAQLRRDQGWPAEALGLLQRAAELFEKWGESEAAGEALAEQGWLALSTGDPEAALDPLLAAVTRLDPGEWPLVGIRARHGLALCHAELGDRAAAQGTLADARELYFSVPDPIERLRFAWLEARIAERGGEAERALIELAPLVAKLLAAGAWYDAAIVAVDLAQLYAALDRQEDLAGLRRETLPLAEPGALPQRARSVLLFCLHMAGRVDRDWTELLNAAGEFLERAREDESRRFRPEAEPGIPELYWDLLALDLRRRICEEAGQPAAAAPTPAGELSPTERDLIAWTYLVVARVRILFDPIPTSA